MQNIKLTLGYDGTAYHGFQVQENALTVQEVLESAVARVFGEATRITPAGRTDAGVHATGQVVNFRTQARIPVGRIPHALNAVLPRDIVVYHAEMVPETFHARYSAVSKTYTYTIDNAPYPRVLTQRFTYHVRFPLSVAAMIKAASSLVGIQDFASFCAAGGSAKTTVRHLLRLDITESGQYITITAEADGFLYNMVRIIAGTLIEVGRGKRPPDLGTVLASRNRAAAGRTAPPHGLVLREVRYAGSSTC